MSNFTFLSSQFPTLEAAAHTAERDINGNPLAACIFARRAVERWVNWRYDNDNTLTRPTYEGDNLNALLGRHDFKRDLRPEILDHAHAVRRIGNQAAHSDLPLNKSDALKIVAALFQILRWNAHRYGDPANRGSIPKTFDPKLVPVAPERIARLTHKALATKIGELDKADAARRKAEASNADLKQQIEAMQAQIAAYVAENVQDDTAIDYTEANTRTLLIDVMLREAGWDPTAPNVVEFPVTGMPDTPSGKGSADYVLWGDNGLPLAVVEAKRTRINPHMGKQQAKLYADCLEAQFGQRPVIFYTNGYETYIWDDAAGGTAGDGYPERKLHGFHNKDDLQRMIQRRAVTSPMLLNEPINRDISGRCYQEIAIGRIRETFSQRRRKALLHMATGTGKTRTTIGLVDVLMRANWVKRVLFLADRKALVKQAEQAFRQHLPNNEPVNLRELSAAEKPTARTARLVVSTYHTILNRLDALMPDGQREYSVGHFDLIVIDEAHRSIFSKFGAIFDYFDAQMVGLTATPSQDIDRNTYELFDLEIGVPTYSYDLARAVGDGHLVEAKPLRIPSQIMERGIYYDDLSESDRAHWDELDWGDDGPPVRIGSNEINKYLFNQQTVDKVLKILHRDGQHVSGGDRIGKTIIFARNQAHAEYIEQRIGVQYPHLGSNYARVISYADGRAQSLITDFKKPDSAPHIAISVDMLDTGIDVPEAVNLVFFKQIFSRIKFDQMIGRGTRLAPNLFGPGQDKEHFLIFDLCRNFEYFRIQADQQAPAAPRPLKQRIFDQRLDLLTQLQGKPEAAAVLNNLRDTLHAKVAGMPLDNFFVRPHRAAVERLTNRDAWNALDADAVRALGNLPSSADVGDREDARRFDLLMLKLQHALLNNNASFAILRNRVIAVADELLDANNIPIVAAQNELLDVIKEETWWTGATVAQLEQVRQRLRMLVQHIPPTKRTIVYTNIEDTFGEATAERHDEFTAGINMRRYKETVERFVLDSEDHPVVQKILAAIPLSAEDITDLETYFYAADETGTRAEFETVYGAQQHFGAFIRTITGIDRQPAKAKLDAYLNGKTFSADQITFIDHIINALADGQELVIKDLKRPPFTYIHNQGPFGIFDIEEVQGLGRFLMDIKGDVRPKLSA